MPEYNCMHVDFIETWLLIIGLPLVTGNKYYRRIFRVAKQVTAEKAWPNDCLKSHSAGDNKVALRRIGCKTCTAWHLVFLG